MGFFGFKSSKEVEEEKDRLPRKQREEWNRTT